LIARPAPNIQLAASATADVLNVSLWMNMLILLKETLLSCKAAHCPHVILIG
jgi:hypothetical protein